MLWQQRREKDEYRLAEMKQEMSRLETKLEAEIKKRVEMNKSLQNYCDEQVAQMTASFETVLDDRAKQVGARLDQLAHEIANLETLVVDEKRNIPLMIESKTNELTQKLVAFMDAFDAERKRRADQESMLLNRLSTHEHATAEAFERERVSADALTLRIGETTSLFERCSMSDRQGAQVRRAQERAGRVHDDSPARRRAVRVVRQGRDCQDPERARGRGAGRPKPLLCGRIIPELH